MMIINRNTNIESQAADAAAAKTSRIRRRPGHWTQDTHNNKDEVMASTKSNKNTTTRRRRRPVANKNKKQQQKMIHQHHHHCDDDSSSASTASTASASLSSSDLSSCQEEEEDQENITNLNKQSIKNKRTQQRKSSSSTTANTTKKSKQPRRKHKKTSSPPSSPKEIQIPKELTPQEKSQYIALDAEMVGVGPHGQHSRLARITLANYDGECIYDTLVQVVETVTDYRTFVSGITPQDLEEGGSAIPFEECRSQVLELITDKIVIGHGLKNDFRVLGVTHPWYFTRDTAKYEPFMKVDPTGEKDFIPKKLKVLAKDKLGLVIQEDGVPHCPLEDAVAALELYKKHRTKWEKAMSYKMERTKAITKC
eukprot:scaffold4648_cov97-Skeletonema_dohrnii-CCMP3373.AAC.3